MDKQLTSDHFSTLDERVKKFLDVLNIGFIHMDMDMGIIDVNEKCLEWFGYRREEAMGVHASQFMKFEDFERLRQLDDEQLEQNKLNYQFEFELPNKHGSKTPYLISVSLDVDGTGFPVNSYVLLTDISEQKNMQEQLEKANQALAAGREALKAEKNMLEAILFGIGDCVTIFDPHGTILLSNPKGKEIRGDRQSPLMPLQIGQSQTFSFVTRGELRQFLGQVEPIRDAHGQVYAYAEILEEITDQIKLEEKESELVQLRREIKRLGLDKKMIGISPAMQKIFDLILRCAEVDSSVLITGETGVGKELVAREIHNQSNRKNKSFIAVNCGAIPEALLESELFGHEKGAFTDAVASRLGLFREANGGTIFLDEIGDLNLSLQVKLLRVLQEREIRPVGGNRTYPIDVRVLTATNKSLEQLVKQRLFRDDLYYRFAVIQIFIPPLRERKEDILPLAKYFLKKHRNKKDQPAPKLNHAIQLILIDYPWPGNIRELENSIEHALAMSRGTHLESTDFPVTIACPNGLKTLPRSEDLVDQPANYPALSHLKPWELEERTRIDNTLTSTRGNRSRAAQELGVSRSTLWRKIKMYLLD